MSETREQYNAEQDRHESRHYLVTLVRDGKAIKGPIYIGAVSHIGAARLAIDKFPAMDSDTIRVWTLSEFDQDRPPVEYAAGNLAFFVRRK